MKDLFADIGYAIKEAVRAFKHARWKRSRLQAIRNEHEDFPAPF